MFTRTKHGADKVVKGLLRDGIAAEAIHGNKSQNQRERVLAAFRKGAVRILVATDIAARGIDVDDITHVVNFDLPNIPETYVHRIGRTARAGAEGIAISLCEGEERAFLRDIERLIRITIPATDRRANPQSERHEARPAVHQQRKRNDQNRNGQHRNRQHHDGQNGERHAAASQPGKRRRPQRGGQKGQDRHSGERNSNDLATVPFLHRAVEVRRSQEQRPRH